MTNQIHILILKISKLIIKAHKLCLLSPSQFYVGNRKMNICVQIYTIYIKVQTHLKDISFEEESFRKMYKLRKQSLFREISFVNLTGKSHDKRIGSQRTRESDKGNPHLD